MSEKTFTRVLIALVAVCLVLTFAHFAWAVYAYQHCSIIEFIARELW